MSTQKLTCTLEEIRPYRIHLEPPNRPIPSAGTGAFGIYAAAYKGALCTVKSLHDASIGAGPHASHQDVTTSVVDKFVNECVLHSKLRHPNIVQFIGVEYEDDHLFLVLERIDMVLQSCLEAFPNIPLCIKLSVLRDVSAGLLYLHSFNPPIIHGDLTTTNILLTHDWRAKIADTGNNVDESFFSTAPGASTYMPQEASVKQLNYDTKLDIFCFGTVSLFVGIQAKACDDGKRDELIQTLSTASSAELECLYEIVTQCCDHDPTKRPSSKDLNIRMEQLCKDNLLPWKDIMQLQCDKVKNHTELEQKVMNIQREMNEAINAINAENETLRKEVETAKQSHDAYKEVIERDATEKQDYQHKIERLEKEIEWLKSKISKSKKSAHEAYVMTVEGQLISLQQDKERLSHTIDVKNKLITELQKDKGSKDASLSCPSDLVEKLKTTELKLMAMEESYQSVLSKLQVITNEKDIFSEDFQKERDDRNRLAGEKCELIEQLEATKQDLAAVKSRLDKEVSFLCTELTEARKELNAAKEEIAVKVAQVKQYQKQVESCKQQLEQSNQQTKEYRQQVDWMSKLKEDVEKQLTEVRQANTKSNQQTEEYRPQNTMDPNNVSLLTEEKQANQKKTMDPNNMSSTTLAGTPIISHGEPPFSEEDCTAGVSIIVAAQIHGSDPVQDITLPSTSTSRPASSGMDTPQQPCSNSPLQYREGGAASSYHAPGAYVPPFTSGPDIDSLPPPILWPQGTVPALQSRPHQEEHGKSADFVVPLDPNLTCPYCHFVFKKGEIQRFRQHVEENSCTSV